MMIIGLASALVLPMIEGGFDAREVRRAARQIASTMHYCRGEAVSLGAPQELVIDTYRNTFTTTEMGPLGRSHRSRADHRRPRRQRARRRHGAGALLPNGSTSGAEVLLASRRDRFANRLRVALDPLLGSVRVEDTNT
jgi:hypothetical protein